MLKPYDTEGAFKKRTCPYMSPSGGMYRTCVGGRCALWLWCDEETQTAYERQRRQGSTFEMITEPKSDDEWKAQGWTLETDWTDDDERGDQQWRRWTRPMPNRKGACSHTAANYSTVVRPSASL